MKLAAYAVSAAALLLASCGGPDDDTAPESVAETAAGTGAETGSTDSAPAPFDPPVEPIPAADIVFWGGTIHTANDEQPTVQAVAVAGDEIVFAGAEAGVQAWFGPETQIVDLNGGAMYPGFTDSHVHVIGVGQRELTLNLEAVTSIGMLTGLVQAAVAAAEPGEVVYGRGWIETHWPEGRFPNRTDIDEVSPDNPVVLIRADGHALLANSAALEAAGIDADSEAPEGGAINRFEDGEPTGILVDNAMDVVTALVAAPTGEERADAYALGSRTLASWGWAGAHDMSVPWSDVALIEDLAEAGRLSTRVYLSVGPDGYAPLAEGGPREAGDGMAITRAVKLYMDGALGSRGAALLEPYADDPSTSGLMLASEDETISVFADALRSGVQMNVHAIGDRGNRLLLDWVEAALEQVPEDQRSVADYRWRDEHTQIVDPADIPRFAELGVIASVQPSHAIGDLHFAPDRLGMERLDGAYAWRSLLEAGAHLTGGSDAPVERGDPRIEFYAAVARRDLEGFSGEGWHPEEALTRQEALRLFTLWPAYASFREDELGSIEVGKQADFTIFSDDIMTIPEAEILDVEPWMTVVDGRVTFMASDAFHRSDN